MLDSSIGVSFSLIFYRLIVLRPPALAALSLSFHISCCFSVLPLCFLLGVYFVSLYIAWFRRDGDLSFIYFYMFFSFRPVS